MEQPINILIVDDEPKNLTVLETILDDPGYRLVRAESADEALLALVVEEFALLILDIRMPSMTGFELAQMIKERKKTAQVPIIFLTAYYNEDQHVMAGYGSGAVDYLHKPVNPAILRSKVAVFAELHRKQRECGTANRALLAEVTERRRAEEQLRVLNETLELRVAERTTALREADRRKDEFLATLAHELRNPLAPIRNALEVMKLTDHDPAEAATVREIMERQVEQMTRLLDDLLEVSRITRGTVTLQKRPIDLATIISSAIETSRPLIDEAGHQLTVNMPAEPVILAADPIRLAQVFSNLLNNAARYSDRGGQIWLEVESRLDDVVVSVRDTGIGIEAEALPRLFKMFVQAAPARKRSFGGLGVGLSLVKGLVELHGGSVRAFSEGVGKGSEFIVTLPLLVEHVVGDADIVSLARTPSPSKVQRRVLVADDSPENADTLTRLLRLLGHEVHTVYGGEAAIEAAQTWAPEVVVLDIGMPDMSGYEAARRIRELVAGRGLFLVALSGWGQEEDRHRSQVAGFNVHLVKPATLDTLQALLADLQPTIPSSEVALQSAQDNR